MKIQETNIQEITNKLKAYFNNRPEVKLVYIFGSLLSGKVNKFSDIDVAILVDTKLINTNSFIYGYKAKIITYLMQALKTNAVDIVVLNEAPPFLRQRIISQGKFIICNDEAARITLQVRTINEFNDMKFLNLPQ